MAYQHVAQLSEIPNDRGICVRVGTLEIGLYRVGERVFAMENACPHAGYPLHEGTVEGRVVICSGHGWEYDLETGLPPGVTADHPLERYRVQVEGDDVLVDVSSPL